MDPRCVAELERRGVEVVSILLKGDLAGPGQGALVRLECGAPDPSRAEVEDWLRKKYKLRDEEATRRHRQNVGWAVAATVAGILSLLWSFGWDVFGK